MFSAAHRKSLATAMAGAALASALVVSGASADPHAIDAAARDAAGLASASDAPQAAATPSNQDLRSPDTRDHAEDYAPTPGAQTVVEEASPPGGFDLVSALVGAAAGTGMLIVLLAASGLARRRPLTRRHGTVGA